jgi:hypothetical protein
MEASPVPPGLASLLYRQRAIMTINGLTHNDMVYDFDVYYDTIWVTVSKDDQTERQAYKRGQREFHIDFAKHVAQTIFTEGVSDWYYPSQLLYAALCCLPRE